MCKLNLSQKQNLYIITAPNAKVQEVLMKTYIISRNYEIFICKTAELKHFYNVERKIKSVFSD